MTRLHVCATRHADGGPCEFAIVNLNEITSCEQLRGRDGRGCCGPALRRALRDPAAVCPHPDGDMWAGVEAEPPPPRAAVGEDGVDALTRLVRLCLTCRRRRGMWRCGARGGRRIIELTAAGGPCGEGTCELRVAVDAN